MKRCLAPCVIRKCKLNNNEIPPHTYQNGQNPKHWQHRMLTRMWSTRNSHSLSGGMQNGTATLEGSLAVSYKTERTLACYPAIAPLDIYPNKLKIYIYTESYMWMFMVALFIITKTWKQPRCASVAEWINCGTSTHQNIIQVHKMDCYSGMKRNELSSHEKGWRNLKYMLLRERSQCENICIYTV